MAKLLEIAYIKFEREKEGDHNLIPLIEAIEMAID